jgi:hypothetical protein
VELELPRNLLCAACDGGGCDACERSGAVTLRDRGEPADLVQVTLPRNRSEPFVVRLPERGGLPPVGSELPRGYLLLRVEPSTQADPSVSLAGSIPALAAARRLLSERPALSRRAGWALLAFVVLLVSLTFWFVRRP